MTVAALTFRVPSFPYFVFAGEDTYEPGRTHPSRANVGVFDVLFVTSGCLYMQENGQRWSLAENDTLILLPDAKHGSFRPCTSTTHFFWLHMQTTGEWGEARRSSALAPVTPPDLYGGVSFDITVPKSQNLDNPETAAVLSQLIDLTQEVDSRARLREQELFQQLIGLMQSGAPPRNRGEMVAYEAQTYLAAHYREPISDARLSEALSYHAGYISRCFKKVHHVTPTAYLTQLRLNQAQRLLASSELPVENVAHAVGYSNVSYFSRLFKQHMGVPPSVFASRRAD